MCTYMKRLFSALLIPLALFVALSNPLSREKGVREGGAVHMAVLGVGGVAVVVVGGLGRRLAEPSLFSRSEQFRDGVAGSLSSCLSLA